MSRSLISSGAPWEKTVGYSRAVVVGSHIFVAGTTATNADGQVIGPGDPYRQTQAILEIIETALGQAGATLAHVVRTRMFVTNIDHWQEIGRAHGDFFKEIRPASTMVEVSRLIDPEHLIEIEVDAILHDA